MKVRIVSAIVSILLLSTLFSTAQTQSKAYLLYIEQYHKIAERQQTEHGIPASIILAQGLLESGAGQGELAIMSNNHFGIKCTDWNGDKVYHDDDSRNECFRKYDQVLDSYEDHAQFLKNRTRYAFLFDLKPTDYEGWAFGLKKAGYATDPTYAFKLISIVENYNLHKFDLSNNVNYSDSNTENKINNQNANQTGYGSMGTVHATINHPVYKVNNIRCITAIASDSYAAIADEFSINEARLREMNEVSSASNLEPGMRVFLNYKKQKADKSSENHRVQQGETMHSISQDYGVKTESLYQLNNMAYTDGAKLNQVLKMR